MQFSPGFCMVSHPLEVTTTITEKGDGLASCRLIHKGNPLLFYVSGIFPKTFIPFKVTIFLFLTFWVPPPAPHPKG